MAIISHFSEIFTRCGRKRSKAGNISKEEVKFCNKVTSYGKIYLKEHDFFQTKINRKIALHMLRYMEISMYLPTPHMLSYMEISMYLPTPHMLKYMEISMYPPTPHMLSYMEISMYFPTLHMLRYMDISIYLPTPHMLRYMKISMYPLTPQVLRYMEISMVSLSEPSFNQALDLRSIQLFWIAWQFLIDI